MKYIVFAITSLFLAVFGQNGAELPLSELPANDSDTPDSSFETQIADTIDTTQVRIGDKLKPIRMCFLSPPERKYIHTTVATDTFVLRNHPITMEEFVSKSCDIYFQQGQIPETESSALIGGGTRQRQCFTLDGLPLLFPQLPVWYLHYQPFWAIEEIYFSPGSHSGICGSGAMAGKIDMCTPMNFPKDAITRVEIAQGDRNLDWAAIRMDHNIFERVGISISGSKLEIDGEYAGENSKAENVSAKIAALIYNDWTVEVYGQSHEDMLDYKPGDTLFHGHDNAAIGAVHLNGKLGNVLLRTGAQLERYKRHLYNNWNELRFGADIVTGDIRAATQIGAMKPILFVQMRNFMTEGTSCADRNGILISTGIHGAIQLGALSAMIATRYDRDYNGNNFPAIDAGARYDFKGGFFTAIAAGTGFRIPTPDELWMPENMRTLYSPEIDTAGDTTWTAYRVIVSSGNEDILPERSFSISLTTGYGNDHFTAALSAFVTSYDNLIEYFSDSISGEDEPDTIFTYPKNISSAKIAGLGASAKWKPLDWLDLGLSYNYTFARDSSGANLPGRPRHYISAYGGIRYGIWENKLVFMLRIEPVYIGYISYSNGMDNVSPGIVLDGRASVRFLDFELFGAAQNIADNRWTLFDGSENLGRQLRFGISWDFFN